MNRNAGLIAMAEPNKRLLSQNINQKVVPHVDRVAKGPPEEGLVINLHAPQVS